MKIILKIINHLINRSIMKTANNILLIVIFLISINGCKENDNIVNNPSENNKMASVNISLPEGSNADLSGASIFSLGNDSELKSEKTGDIVFNDGSVELAYLLDRDNNVLLAGFISDNRKEISVETTTEVMLYYALDYYLLPDNAKQIYLNNVKQVPGFFGLVESISNLFKEDPLMYSEGKYLPILREIINQIFTDQSFAYLQKRIVVNGEAYKSGITVAKIDSTHIKLQNSYPRYTKVFIYKKSFYDRNKNLFEISNYTATPFKSFDFDPVETQKIEELEVGNSISVINANAASINNTSSTDPIELPVNKSSELAAEYEVIVIGSGSPNSIDRDLTENEQKAYEDINVKTYALKYLLPALLDISGNKNLLPPAGSNKENELLNAVLPVLEANEEVLNDIKQNDFKTATEALIPKLYGDIRLSDELRTLLTNVYNIISNNGSMPNTFVQSHELIETGAPRIQKIMDTIYKNMDFGSKVNINMLNTSAKSVESWTVDCIDAIINLIPEQAEVCLGEAQSLKVTCSTIYDPNIEEFEYHWSTDDNFGGRIQDINNDPNNFGKTIITKADEVSYISTALESELSSGDNIETIRVTVYLKNKNTGELSDEVAHTTARMNNKKGCASFFASFTKEVTITSHTALGCNNGEEYTVGHPFFITQFNSVDGANSYKAKILRKDGTYGNEYTLSDLEEIGNGMLKYKLGVGPIFIFSTCNQAEAEQEQQNRLDYLDEVGHQGIEITPVF